MITKTYSLRSVFKTKHFSIVTILLLCFNQIKAKTWYINKNQNGNKLQELVNQATNGDMIYFVDAGDYDMGGKIILVNKAITFQGYNPKSFDPTKRGVSGIQTNLLNLTSFQIRSNNIKFNNLKIETNNDLAVLIDGRSDRYNSNFTNPGYTANDQYTGIALKNVELSGGFYSCFAGNGMGASFENVSFLNFRRLGYINDRRTRVSNMKKVNFFRCRFKPAPPSGQFGFDTRGISFDAGNTSFPVVWNAEGSSINQCNFENTGVGLSRIKNVSIKANTFTDSSAVVDMIHVEEFSNAITIDGNKFICSAQTTRTDFERTKLITLDSELQAVSNITIKNNTVEGQYNFFIFGYAPTNLTITNNNLTNATAFNPTIINLTYYENQDKAGEGITSNQQFISRNITITGNSGLAKDSRNFKMNIQANGLSNNIPTSQFASGKIEYTYLQNPVALRSSGVYQIQNAGNTARRLATDGTTYGLTTSTALNNRSKWEIKFIPPYYYTFKNLDSGKYLETHKGYTEAEILNNATENVYPFVSNAPSELPKWILRKTAYSGLFKILPAGNEKQSVLTMSNNDAKLIMHKKYVNNTRVVKEPNNFGMWWIWPTSSGKEITNLSNTAIQELQITPTVIDNIANFYFEDEENPVLELTLYNTNGALVLKDKLNAFVNNAIDVSGLASGIYLAKTSNDIVTKIIIK